MSGDTTRGRIGVLDLQGGVCEHLDHLERSGCEGIRVKDADDLTGLAGLIIPGGESTCLSRLLRIFHLHEAIREACRGGMKVWGTCAGAILLATAVRDDLPTLELMDMMVERNSFGSQMDSFTAEALVPPVSPKPLPLVFIRAPIILRVGAGVSILLRLHGFIAAAESAIGLATVFHPELSPALAFHRYFARKCGLRPGEEAPSFDLDPSWNTQSWVRRAALP